MELRLRLFGFTWLFQSKIRKNRDNLKVYGYTNRCQDGKYIIFLDYDNMSLNWIKDELKALQELFFIGDFHILRSSENSYHCVCFDKVSIHLLITLMQNSSIDSNYLNVPLKFGQRLWTLRLSDKYENKINFVETLFALKPSSREQSSAHIKLFENYFNLKINPKKEDGIGNLVLAKYSI